MIYNVIGDIHGRSSWQTLVREDAVNLFVGDYFDPYKQLPHAEVMNNFRSLIDYHKSHPTQCVLLYGNHDFHYISGIAHERSSRYDAQHAAAICQAFNDSAEHFSMAFSIGNRVLVTHAGVTSAWWNRYFPTTPFADPDHVAAAINGMWNRGERAAFSFSANADGGDADGSSPQQSPLWVRPETLLDNNLFADTDFLQAVGHTQFPQPAMVENVIFVDCLETMPKTFSFNL